MDPVIHFQMPSKDHKRTADFYSKVFGWQMKQLGQEFGQYMTADTTPVGKDMRPVKPGAINGGFFTPTEDPDSRKTTIVIAVDDINESLKKVLAAGGTTKMKGPDAIPNVGLFMTFKDTEGNFVAMLQPKM
jgi:uncharacterized protein